MPTKSKQTIKNYVQETQLFQSRIIMALVFIAICSVFLVLRLFYLQVIEQDLYNTLSNQNQFNLIPVEPNRGLIYDRNGVLLAENVPIFNLVITPERVSNLKDTISNLQQFIDITPDDIDAFNKSLKSRRPYEPVALKLKLSDEELAKFYVNQYRFPGVSIDASLMRNYPLGGAFDSVLGYVGRINEDDLLNIDTANYAGSNYIGKIGIEKYFEKELHGTVGYQQVEINASGRAIRTLKRIPTIPGENIYLTIDSNLQRAAEQALIDTHTDGAVVAIDPHNGQVLALVSNPNYDPNLFVNGISKTDFQQLQNDPDKPLYNRALRGVYPPGSTVKVLMAIGALDNKIITPTYSINDHGIFTIPGVNHAWHDWVFPRNHGMVNVAKAIMVSCDTFMFTIGMQMGADMIDATFSRFGLGRKTGIEEEEEIAGVLPSPAWKLKRFGAPWFAGDTVVASIGQGYVAVTPLQLARAISIIANRGVNYRPTLVLKMQKPDGTFVQQQPIKEQPVVLSDPSIWDLVINAMQNVTKDPQGTAYPAWKDAPYSAAAKTGTSQVVRRAPGKVDPASLPPDQRNHSLFIVFAPADNPQIALAVVAEHAIVPAKVIARKIVDYYLITEHHWNPASGAPTIEMINSTTTTSPTATTPTTSTAKPTTHGE